ncbi:YhcG family protein [Flavobacterium sp. 5]|uniref:PDDEXK nuclease domain-containing protein n=1 Tax=Flavobacterium sp. 5 TaxID=2035199 RepID=UPI000C2C7383|nr:PDDEXK nuclease domain-containing protein [Flavobacterium sp. 5]PKB15435.1 putative nuclease of restriction endonuclease-like (RecB) superfamily [Flavobacterium sp. 5]
MELQEQFSHITALISKAKESAYHAVNKELVTLYWHVGEYVSQQVEKKTWGKSVVKELSLFIQQSEPNIVGFSPQNIWRMKQFVETYKNLPKLATLSRELSWSQNRLILPLKSSEEQEFYLLFCIKEKWSVRELERQINTSCFERVMLANEKLATLSGVFPKEITNTFKDTYVLELLQLPESHLEKDLRKAIAQNITKFLLEFGRDFAFMGEEYPLQVGSQDFAIDLLFYNRNLNCMVAIELKIEKFKPEHLGQLNFYLEALDRDIRKPHEQPSIGILLCNGKDDIVVEYALNRTISPTLVADYQTKLPSKELLQRKWKEILESLSDNNNKQN